ncbi:MAG: DsrE family protein [Epsilonproteobacteria bacterium]|nr:DsrE family protein [Campylobacterota bacterium]
MKKIILLLVSTFTLLLADAPSLKVVYDLTTQNQKDFERKILKAIVANKAYYEGKLQELDVTVVIHGGAYRYFTVDPSKTEYKTDKTLLANYTELKKRIKSMSDTYDVEFLMCEAGMLKHGLKAKDIVSYVKIIPNSTIGLIDRQNEGYAYIPVGD